MSAGNHLRAPHLAAPLLILWLGMRPTSAGCGAPPPVRQVEAPPADSTYASEHLRRVVERAAAAHAHPPATLASFTSSVESEMSLLVRQAAGDELPAQIEQIAGRVTWLADGHLEQEVTGYRSLALGPTVSVLNSVRAPWVIAPLYGDRVPVLFATDSADAPAQERAAQAEGGRPSRETSGGRSPGRVGLIVHPFATDRAEYYRFSGGDTALSMRLPDREVPLIRIRIEAVGRPGRGLLFQGEILLDAVRHQIVRMRGELLGRVSRQTAVSRVLALPLRLTNYVELDNAEWEGAYWLPRRQRIEIEVAPVFAEDEALLRIVTAFHDIEINPPGLAAPSDTGAAPGRPRLVVPPADVLRGFREWRSELGAATSDARLDDFEDVGPESTRPTGPPRVRFGTGSFPEVLRYDRIEGLFTGFGARLDLRDVAPGAFVDLDGGYAWAESTVRGGLEAGVRRDRWGVGAEVRRRLASTNDFPRRFGAYPTIFGVFGQDDFDYVDRYSAEVQVGVGRAAGAGVSLRVGAVRDREALQRVFRGSFRPNRPVREGDYARLALTATVGTPSGTESLAPGIGAYASWEAAWGALAWQRIEAAVRVRSQRGRWRLAGEVLGGTLVSKSPPPQAIFELGSVAGRLPSFGYKAFVGDRAAVGAVQAMWVPPLLDAPIRIGPVFLPALAPSPALELSAGWTGVSGRAASLVESYGWEDSAGVRATVFVGVRVLGGALGLGAARPLGEPGRWRLGVWLLPGA